MDADSQLVVTDALVDSLSGLVNIAIGMAGAGTPFTPEQIRTAIRSRLETDFSLVATSDDAALIGESGLNMAQAKKIAAKNGWEYI